MSESLNAVYEYEGGFAGYLCAAAELINAAMAGGDESTGRPAASVAAAGAAAGLFEERVRVPRDDARAAALWRRLSAKAGVEAMETIRAAFLSDLAGADGAAARLLARLARRGARALDALGDPDAILVEKAAHRTRAETHLMLGLVRFSELADGSYYASARPDCDTLPLMGDHFAARFPDMRWAIHDRRRGSAALHLPGSPWRLVEGFSLGVAAGDEAAERPTGASEPSATPYSATPYSANERELRAAWALYFQSVAIAERTNERLQSGHMPKKYWDELPEFGPGVAPGQQGVAPGKPGAPARKPGAPAEPGPA